jgi:23S rRNA (adenine1618-N6)-methyltransferase
VHPRNRHQGHYDFDKLVAALPALSAHVVSSPRGEPTIDFSDPAAVRALNRALLKHHHGVAEWDVPEGFLCPPIPGRSDTIHHAADLLASSNGGVVPRGPAVRVLDVGVGATAIYPIIGNREYGWSFVGTDISDEALASTRRIVEANPELRGAIETRKQTSPPSVLAGVVRPGEEFDLMVCNPPFHASLEEVQAGSARKWRGLGRAPGADGPIRNFGGQGAELWCPGGEVAFVGRLVDESARIGQQVLWFTALVSKESSLYALELKFDDVDATDVHVIEMGQGQKRSRLLAWTYRTESEHGEWRARRWRG